MTQRSITLLGPQRRPQLDKVVTSLGYDGPFATISAGWIERERDDAELDAHLGGRSVNLHLWTRLQQVLEEDHEFAKAHRRRNELLRQLQELYLIGLSHTMDALRELRADTNVNERLQLATVRDAQYVLRNLDKMHLSRVREVHEEFFQLTQPHERPAVSRNRREVAQLLDDCAAVIITGGHVGEMLDSMHLFNVVPAGLDRLPIIAWSAGAMVLTDHVALFNDHAIRSPRATEMFSLGLGLLSDVVVFPNARQRLDMSDKVRMAGIATRFAPARCVPLDAGFRATVVDGVWPDETPMIGPQGSIISFGEESDAEAGDQPTA